MSAALIAWLHYVALCVLFSVLVAEHLLFDDMASAALARRLAVLDAILGVAAVLVLLTGIARVLSAPQGADFFLQNWVFHAKLTLFFGMALVSVWPTIHFLRGRRLLKQGAAQVTYPRRIKVALRVQMAGFLLILLLAAMMARGIGYYGG